MPFRDRREAAKLLAKALEKYRGLKPLILAIPRGAVPMGQILARELGGDLDVVLVHKLGAPGQPEYAIGAIDETGQLYLNPGARILNLPPQYIEGEKAEQLELLARRRRTYTPGRPPLDPKGRIVIILDDGIATGSTMIAALKAIREQGPEKLIVATAVAPPDTMLRIGYEADEVVSLEMPVNFQAVGQFFENFNQVSDAEVIEILSGEREETSPDHG